ncbi:hypothetical protein TWF694_011101 [Orbilia ellipsospora]|uniref:Uncharacterized protein n=1 Tax=Orbilia ellipsospora TaxID=2528407 RepID=A0AAV9XB30_9PEZI
MANSNSFWEETARGQWTRPFDPIERLFNRAKSTTPELSQYIISAGAVLDLSPQEFSLQSIRNAWIALRAQELEKWADETIKIIDSGGTGREIATSAPAPRSAELYFLPAENEIFVQVQHELTDAIGSMMLLNNLIILIRGGDIPSQTGINEVSRLSPSLAQLMDGENPTPRVIELAQKNVEAMAKPRISLKSQSLEIAPTFRSKRFEHTFDKAQTHCILQACKQKGMTVTHATIVATARALLKYNGLEVGEFGQFLQINLRDTLPSPYDRSMRPIMNCFTSKYVLFPVSSSGSFSDAAKSVREEYNAWKSNRSNVASHGPFCAALEKTVAEPTNTLGSAILEEMFNVSGLGLVSRYITESIQDFWLSVTVGSRFATMYVYTVNDSLRYVVVYNSEFYDEKIVANFVQSIVREMTSGLDIIL